MVGILKRFRNMQGNSKVVAKNTFYAFLIKGGALAISFFSTPLFIKYFDNNVVLGLWYTLLAVLNWFLAFDLGIGNGIRNHLVKAITVDDRKEAKRILSSGFLSVGAVSILMAIIGSVLILTIDLNSFFNISESVVNARTLKQSTLLIFYAIVLRFMLTTVSSVFYALQRSAVNNFLALCVSLLLFLYVLIFRFDNPDIALINISWSYLVICNLPIIIAGFLVFMRELKDCRPNWTFINRESINKIMGVGIIFFLCQIAYLIIASTNEFFVSHFWDPLYAADYGFYYRIIMLVSMMASLALTPTWSMITKAYTEGNYSWLRKLYLWFKRAGLAVIVLQFLIVPFLQPIMDIWLGRGQLHVTWQAAVAFACYGSVFIYSSMLSTIVCGLAKMRLQMWCYGVGCLLKIAFIIMISKISDDWLWVVWSNVLILAPYCILQQWQLNSMFKVKKTVIRQ